jgi:ABC-type glycerol-3-phosphate transport system substrate-binding protein
MRCRLVVSTVVLVALLMAPSTFAKESITVWHSLDTGEASKSFDAICEDFSKAHPEIEAEIVYIGGYVQGMEKALVAWAGGAAPNVAMFEQTRSAAFYYSGALLDIGPYINGTQRHRSERFLAEHVGCRHLRRQHLWSALQQQHPPDLLQ